MTEISPPDGTGAAPQAPSPGPKAPFVGAGRVLLGMARRSGDNRRATLARIAHRRLWRPASYPSIPWKSWLWLGLVTLVVVGATLDAPVGNFRRQWPNGLIVFAETATKAGMSGWYLIPAAIIGVTANLIDWSTLAGRRLLRLYNWTGLALFVLLSTGLSGLIATFLKHAFGRARPLHFGELGAFAFDPFSGSSSFASFPSGHSCTVGSVATILVLLLPSTRFVVIPVALVIASTRIVLSSHYPSDVLGGLMLGAGFTLLVAVVFARLGYVFEQSPSGLPRRRKSFSVFW